MHAPFLPTLDVNLLKNNQNLWGDLRLKPTGFPASALVG